MISGRYSDDAALRLFVGERENGVGGSAEFERTGFLQIFAFEKQMRTGHVVDGFRGEDRSAMNERANTRMSRTDGLEIRCNECGRLLAWCR